MPIYEYYCAACHRIYNFLVRRPTAHRTPRCPKCGGRGMTRRFSRFAAVRSEQSRLDRLADDPDLGGIDENDPKALARMMRTMGSELGEELGPEFNELVGRLEAGEDPEQIEKDLGDAPADEDGQAAGGPPGTDETLYEG